MQNSLEKVVAKASELQNRTEDFSRPCRGYRACGYARTERYLLCEKSGRCASIFGSLTKKKPSIGGACAQPLTLWLPAPQTNLTRSSKSCLYDTGTSHFVLSTSVSKLHRSWSHGSWMS